MKELIKSNVAQAAVSITPDAEQRKREILAELSKIVIVSNPQEQNLAVHQLRELRRYTNEIEATRKSVKAPVITLGKRIDELAETHVKELVAEESRINRLVLTFQQAEQKRIDEENALLEAERKAAEKKAQDALAEQQRLAESGKAKPKQEIKAEEKVQEALSNVAAVASKPPSTAASAAGLTAKKVVKYEITNATELYKVRPEFFELVPRASVIKAAITAQTKLPGLRVYEELDARIRA